MGTPLHCRQRQQVPPNQWYICTRLHGIMSQTTPTNQTAWYLNAKVTVQNFTAVATTNLISPFFKFSVQGSVHRKCIPIYVQQDAMLHSLFISQNCSTCFRWYLHPSSGAHRTVSTASGTCQTITATAAIAAGSSYSLTSARCYRYSCV